jgi:hypothetical protein
MWEIDKKEVMEEGIKIKGRLGENKGVTKKTRGCRQ